MDIKNKRFLKYILPVALITVFLVACLCVYFYKVDYKAPDFEKNVQVGLPNIEEGYNGYYPVKTSDGEILKLCGKPSTTENSIDFYLTNEKDNNTWVLLEVYDENDEFLGKCGVIKQNEFLETITLDKCLNKGDNKVKLKLRTFEPEEYYSKGTINLETVVKVN